MSWTNAGLLGLLLTIIAVVGVFGAYAGYDVNGVQQGINADNSSGIGSEIFGFLGNMITFQIDNMPFALNTLFVVISILTLYLIYALIRGVS